MPGAPFKASTSMPESSAMLGRPVCRQAWRALRMAFSTKVSPVSSAGSTPKCDCGSSSMPSPCSSAATSRVLPSLLLARTTRMGLLLQGLPLQLDQLGDAFAGQCRHLVELLQPEGMAFGGALQLDERAGIVHHHVHVGLGLR